MSSHTTVHIEIHRVVPGGDGAPTCRCIQPCQHAKPRVNKSDTEVVNLTARVDGTDDAALDRAINKATAHLNCERPNGGK